ncbi:hypothetical protein MTO96_009888 [Rhipicephalus appendiculatus]
MLGPTAGTPSQRWAAQGYRWRRCQPRLGTGLVFRYGSNGFSPGGAAPQTDTPPQTPPNAKMGTTGSSSLPFHLGSGGYFQGQSSASHLYLGQASASAPHSHMGVDKSSCAGGPIYRAAGGLRVIGTRRHHGRRCRKSLRRRSLFLFPLVVLGGRVRAAAALRPCSRGARRHDRRPALSCDRARTCGLRGLRPEDVAPSLPSQEGPWHRGRAPTTSHCRTHRHSDQSVTSDTV